MQACPRSDLRRRTNNTNTNTCEHRTTHKTTSIKLQRTFFSVVAAVALLGLSLHLTSCIHFISYIDCRRGTFASFNHHYDQKFFCNFSLVRFHRRCLICAVPQSISRKCLEVCRLSTLIGVDGAADATISNDNKKKRYNVSSSAFYDAGTAAAAVAAVAHGPRAHFFAVVVVRSE